MKKIEIHAIQSFPAHCLNRGKDNEPKSMVFGGALRARVSSQCWKRATRMDMKQAGVQSGIRTRKLASVLADMVPEATLQDAHALISGVFAAPKDNAKAELKKGDKKANVKTEDIQKKLSEDTSNVLIFISAGELEEAAQCLREKVDLPEAAARIKKAGLSPDVGMFGRMLAEHDDLGVDGACQVAHAFSTHAIKMEEDFFTAVDDLALAEGTVATAMFENASFNASVFYRYAAIDMNLLTKNLGGDEEKAEDAARAFVRAFVLALPTAKQTSFAANNLPSFVMLVGRESGPALSLANAYVKPLEQKGDLVAASITAMLEHADQLNEMYAVYSDAKLAFIADREAEFAPWTDARVDSLPEAIKKVLPNG